jgi:hypothetical protein
MTYMAAHVGAGADYNGVSEALGWGDVVFVNTIHPNRAQRTVKLSPVFSSLEKTESLWGCSVLNFRKISTSQCGEQWKCRGERRV